MEQLFVLGSPYVMREVEGVRRPVSLQPKLMAILTYLVMMANRGPVRRDTLVAMFWPDLDEKAARNSLSQALFRLRQAIGKKSIVSVGGEELAVNVPEIECDASEFTRLVDRGKLREAIDQYRGPFLAGLHIHGASDYSHWLTTERERLRTQACDAVDSLAKRDESESNWAGAARWLQRCLELAPDDERILQRLMHALDKAGDRAGAIHSYQSFRKRLAEELDLRPSPQTETMVHRLRAPGSGKRRKPDDFEASIAVLPFDNFSEDPGQEYLCSGITEEVIAALARTRGLRVAARKSLEGMGGQAVDIRKLASQLNVSNILEGSVRRSGDRVRVAAQLIDSDGYHVWSENYDRRVRDVLAIQEDLAHSIALALSSELIESATQATPTVSRLHSQAHDLYFRGIFHRHRRTRADMDKARECFEKAVAADPGFAQAHAALAFHHSVSGHFHYDFAPPEHAYPLAKSAMETAMSIDDQIAEIHLVQGLLRSYYEWDWPGAERSFIRALELDPDNPYTLASYSTLGVRPGQSDKFITLSRRCEMLDPFWINAKTQVGIGLFIARRYTEAQNRFEQAQEMQPEWPLAPLYLGDIHLVFERFSQARSCYDRLMEIIGRQPMVLNRLGILEATLGSTARARDLLSELANMRQSQFVRASYLADIHFVLGENSEAYTLMDEAVNERDTRLITLDAAPFYDRFKNEPGFQRLLETVGLTA